MSLQVIYRACPLTNPDKIRPIPDKTELVKTCFRSFLDAFTGVDYQLTVLLDKPNDSLHEFFAPYQVEETYYADFDEGNIRSFHRQIDLALEAKQPFFFLEDDYYFLPGAGEKLAAAINQFPLVTPYDHPGYYSEDTHDYKRNVQIVGGHHWQTVISTTLTFGGQHETLVAEAQTMKKYGWADHPMFCDITQRYSLWCPIPSLATHCEVPHLAPCINWTFANPTS
jgi:hypothetical protein